MNRSRVHEQIKRVFLQARALPEEERAAFIARACGGDESLAERVRNLIDADQGDDAELFDAPPVGGDWATGERDASLLPRFGERYRALALLGCGGAGDVYLAEQLTPVRRQVAIKLLRPEFVAGAARERLRREARFLATLDHPGITRLLDSGEAPDGRPFIVIEYVDGQPIDRYCRENALSIRGRLELFSDLCAAIEHAHQREIVHRDIKPSNVLVCWDGSRHRVRLVDLGVARLLAGAQGSMDSRVTHTGAVIGSLGYMSPEQISGRVIDTRTDVYALGVLLHNLCGSDEPVRTSGGNRQWRDLAAIAAKACEPIPNDRYQSVGALREDIRRLMAGDPVTAKAQTLRYRLGKASRKHPMATAAIAVTATGLCLLAAALVTKNRELRIERAEQAELIGGVMTDVIDQLGLYAGTREERERLIEALSDRTDSLLAVSPDDSRLRVVRAWLMVRESDILYERGNKQAAATLRGEAAGTLGEVSQNEPENIDILRRHIEAVIKHGDALAHLGRLDEVYEKYRRAKRLQVDALEKWPEHIGLRSDLQWSYDRLLSLYERRGQTERARQLAGERLDRAKTFFDEAPNQPHSQYNLMVSLIRAALMESDDGDSDLQAREMLHRAVEIGRNLVEQEPARLAFSQALQWACSLLGTRLWQGGEWQAAVEYNTEAVDVARQIVERHGEHRPARPELLIDDMCVLISRLKRSGHMEDARALREDLEDLLYSLSDQGVMLREKTIRRIEDVRHLEMR